MLKISNFNKQGALLNSGNSMLNQALVTSLSHRLLGENFVPSTHSALKTE